LNPTELKLWRVGPGLKLAEPGLKLTGPGLWGLEPATEAERRRMAKEPRAMAQ
jgi:hypothetical protein